MTSVYGLTFVLHSGTRIEVLSVQPFRCLVPDLGHDVRLGIHVANPSAKLLPEHRRLDLQRHIERTGQPPGRLQYLAVQRLLAGHRGGQVQRRQHLARVSGREQAGAPGGEDQVEPRQDEAAAQGLIGLIDF